MVMLAMMMVMVVVLANMMLVRVPISLPAMPMVDSVGVNLSTVLKVKYSSMSAMKTRFRLIFAKRDPVKTYFVPCTYLLQSLALVLLERVSSCITLLRLCSPHLLHLCRVTIRTANPQSVIKGECIHVTMLLHFPNQQKEEALQLTFPLSYSESHSSLPLCLFLSQG